MRRPGALFAATLGLAVSAAACTVQQDEPDLRGQDIRLTFIHTSDIHSRLFPYTFQPNTFDKGFGLTNAPFGGIARIASLAKQIRASAQRSVWLDSGDCFQGAPIFNLYRGEAEFRALTELGLDGAVIGNHEFDLGSNNLYEQIVAHSSLPAGRPRVSIRRWRGFFAPANR